MTLQLIDLLARGYFPKELPPPFRTADFASTLTRVSPAAAFDSKPHFSLPCVHNLVRAAGLRRNLSVPNPKHFYRLATHVVNHWGDYSAIAASSPYSLTKPTTGGERAIAPENDLDRRTVFRAGLRARGKYLLRADVTRFFPSVYTHSIPWAVIGKSAAKAAHSAGSLKGQWHDIGDMLSRSVMNNQTVGLPIGPDTSRLIAEVILTRVDLELQNAIPKLNGIRYIDDYEFVCATRSQAEDVLSKLQHFLNDFELALNSSKTSIVELPEPLDHLWTSELRTYSFSNTSVAGQRHELTAYFDKAFKFAKLFPEDGLLKYAIARLSSEPIREANLELFEDILCHCVIVEPACLPQVCDQLAFYMDQGYFVRRRLWSECLNRLIGERVPLGHSSEAAWAMWLMRMLKVRMHARSAKVVSRSEDAFVGLMALALASVGLATLSHLSGLDRFANPDEIYGSQWPLCYEGNCRGWLGPTSGISNLKRDPAIDFMATNNVSFIDINVPIPVPAKAPVPVFFSGGLVTY